ncbi:MAG: M43 family zinc metalloprotease [Bacteroidota bacterium]
MLCKLSFTQEVYCTQQHAHELFSGARILEDPVLNEVKNVRFDTPSQYIIPTVVHVFHNGEEGKLDLDQVLSGLKTINEDFAGLNEDWEDVDPLFAELRGKLDLRLQLATLDPDGNSTSGVVYYDDKSASLNQKDLYENRWDISSYLNIYLPIYINGEPSVGTAYASLPMAFYIDSGRDGIYYSSVRWGLGDHSELEPGSELASIATHEVGHWLGLYHTFQRGCSGPGDYVPDTPPASEEPISLGECPLEVSTCGNRRNIENYMDYFHGCKKMFTQGQVLRMINVLHEPFRKKIWSTQNLIKTGILDNSAVLSQQNVIAFENSVGELAFQFNGEKNRLVVYNLNGKRLFEQEVVGKFLTVSRNVLEPGLLFYVVFDGNDRFRGKILLSN